MIELLNSSELQVWCEADVMRAQHNPAFHLSLILVTSFVLGQVFIGKLCCLCSETAHCGT